MGAESSSSRRFQDKIIVTNASGYFQDKTYFDRMQYTHLVVVIPNKATQVSTSARDFGFERDVIVSFNLDGKRESYEFPQSTGIFRAP